MKERMNEQKRSWRGAPACYCSRSVLTAASGSPCFTMLSPTRMAPQPAAEQGQGQGHNQSWSDWAGKVVCV